LYRYAAASEGIHDDHDHEDNMTFVGEHCEHVAEVLTPGETVAPPPLHVGNWAYFYVPLPPAGVSGSMSDGDAGAGGGSENRPLVIELAYPRSPAAAPMLFATKDKSAPRGAPLGGGAIPKLEAACASFWGSGPYGGAVQLLNSVDP
jgi:hypothetical protein